MSRWVAEWLGASTSTNESLSEDALALLFADRHAHKLRYVAPWGQWLL
jgi:hypothetical protein